MVEHWLRHRASGSHRRVSESRLRLNNVYRGQNQNSEASKHYHHLILG
jgi:hypothetical protein